MNHRKIPALPLLVALLLLGSAIQACAADRNPEHSVSGRTKEWSLGYSYIHLKTNAGNTYDIHSTALNYFTRNRWRMPLVTSTTLFFPIAIGYNGGVFSNLWEYYKRVTGLEFMMGIEFNGSLGEKWRWRFSPGWNINGISMPGESGYYPFQSLTTGPAVNLVLEKDWEQGMIWRFGIYGSYQFYDLIHSGERLSNGFSFQFLAGISFRDGSAFGRIDYE